MGSLNEFMFEPEDIWNAIKSDMKDHFHTYSYDVKETIIGNRSMTAYIKVRTPYLTKYLYDNGICSTRITHTNDDAIIPIYRILDIKRKWSFRIKRPYGKIIDGCHIEQFARQYGIDLVILYAGRNYVK